MNTFRSRRLALVAGLGLGLFGLAAAADDTEIFFGGTTAANASQPNILFLYDDSGSMSSTVVTQETWNPNTKFDGCYDGSVLYYSTNGTVPGCSSTNKLNKSANFCQASATPLANLGSYRDNIFAWRSDQKKWVAVNSSSPSRPLECQADQGATNPVGQAAGDGKPWAVNGATSGWAATKTAPPTWNSNVTIYDGNWLNWNSTGGSVTKTRIQIIQEVTDNLLQTLTGVNVALETFNYDEGGYIAHQMQDVGTARATMTAQVDALAASSWTPLSESLYEALNYYYGRGVDYGNVGPVKSVAASRTGNSSSSNTYLKPVTAACQQNYIVILTDGLPTHDVSATAKIQALPQWATTVSKPSCSMTGDGACMIDLAEYLNKHDLDSSMAGVQNVITYTVGFGTDLSTGDTTFLKATAAKGGGQYYLATDTASLSAALTKIIYSILDNSTTYTTPTAPVNAFNRTQNLNDVFVSVFQPSPNMHWPGNLKRYYLQNGVLVGQDGAAAVDPATGFFSTKSWSFWSPSPDGSTAAVGGAASQLPDAVNRNLYTNLTGTHLNAAGNAVAVANNANITPAMVGAPSNTERDNVLNWARGLDLMDDNDNGLTTDNRQEMGDPLHVRPVTVVYGGTASSPDATIFVSTNDGYLHAIDSKSGKELWAFVPKRLLSRLYGLYQDPTVTSRSYGLDGEIYAWVMNDDGQPGINPATERVILYFGMRRGGDSVFAVDVTNRNDPQVLWEVNSTTAGFGNLGETFSTPTVARVNIGGSVQQVAIFGGGYDDGEDNPGYRTDAVGRSIYMVDALTGALLWKAGNATVAGANLVLPMNHSIPAGVRVLDMNGDGLADRMYVGDMGGRLWRFDIANGQPAATLVTGGIMATLGAADLSSPTLADVRRFYATPDVAQVISGSNTWLTVSLGSGHREHPLDTGTTDEFYSVRDYHVFDALANAAYATPITRTNLVDVTNNANPTLAAGSAGWRMGLVQASGEKVVTESRTFANTVFFASFAPGAAATNCTAAGGSNRLYEVSVVDGSPVANLDGSAPPDASNPSNNPLTITDRFRVLKQGGIAPEPVFLFPADQPQNPVTCVGVECFSPGFGNAPVRTLWNQTGTE